MTFSSRAVILAFAIIASARAQEALAAPFAYVPNLEDDTVSVIDTATNSVSATIAVGHSPLGAAVTPDGKWVYVTNRDDGTVSVIDALTNTTVGTVDAGMAPAALAINPMGTRLFVVNAIDPGTVSVIDTADNTMIASVPVGRLPFGVAVTPDGTRAYVTNTFDDRERRPCSINPLLFCDITVSVIDAVDNVGLYPFPVGDRLGGVAVDPTGARIYVANESVINGNPMGVLSIVDAATDAVVRRVPVSLGGASPSVVVTRNGDRAFVTASFVAVIDTATYTVTTMIPVGQLPAGMAINPAGTRLYVANSGDNSVSVVDIAESRVIETIKVGRYPVALGQFVGPELSPVTPTASPMATASATARPASTATATPTLTVPTQSAASGGGCSVTARQRRRGATSIWLLAFTGLLWARARPRR